MYKKIKISIGIPAHNEESNIKRLLLSILNQQVDNRFEIKKIIVACDGCTDNTSKIVKSMKNIDSRISVIDDGKRLGQSGRLNNFYKLLSEDVFITFDADTRLSNNHVVNELAKKFVDEKVMLVGGNDTPDTPRNFIEKVGSVWVESWYIMRRNINKGDTVHNHKGCVSAGRLSFLKKLRIPKDVFANDDYLYFSCKEKGFKFEFAEKAVVYYRIPSNFKEYMTQTTRFLGLKHRIPKYFGKKVYGYYKIPLKNKITGIIKELIKEPFYMTIAIFMQIFQRVYKNKYIENYSGVSWKEIKSSKS